MPITSHTYTYSIKISGLVQGVGFRPFIYQLASELKVHGSVENRTDGVFLLVNTTPALLDQLIEKIRSLCPPAASIDSILTEQIHKLSFDNFQILPSRDLNDQVTRISPDIAVCDDCLQDMQKQEHRLHYPFTNCTHCGPRFTILRELPYDRARTTMSDFPMCPECEEEYHNVLDRRFHAQPVACLHCGPHYSLWKENQEITDLPSIFQSLADLTEAGKIIAIKGLGGFHLMCDAYQSQAVETLRNIKHRESKPFAVMCPDLLAAAQLAFISAEEAELLVSWKRPVVLLRSKNRLAPGVANGLNHIGIMLPYLPFHHLLFQYLDTKCIVLTSGNLSDEPILIDNHSARDCFHEKTAAIVTNNRDIHNRCDDSVVIMNDEAPMIIRRARGYVPSPLKLNFNAEGIYGAGAELVNCFGMGKDNYILMSQHIGDLKNAETYDFYRETYQRFARLFRFSPRLVVADLHPDYLSGVFAKELAEEYQVPFIRVQHHHAHLVSCMAEHHLTEPVIGISMDGVGLGTDGNIWGAEFMVTESNNFIRKYHFEYIPIAGGSQASLDPWRSATSFMIHYFGEEGKNLCREFFGNILGQNLELYLDVLHKKIHTFNYSSAGRLFDAAAAISGVCLKAGYQAEAPMRFESLTDLQIHDSYPFGYSGENINLKQVFRGMINDRLNGISSVNISTRFHNTLATIILETSRRISADTGIRKVVVSGGSFQNIFLINKLIHGFKKENMSLYIPVVLPVSDAGIAAGQITIAASQKF